MVGLLRGVQEVDVDAVFVVLGADRGDGGDGVRGAGPAGADHGAAVVDQEDGVEGGEEGVGVFGLGGGCDGGGGGQGAVGGCCGGVGVRDGVGWWIWDRARGRLGDLRGEVSAHWQW